MWLEMKPQCFCDSWRMSHILPRSWTIDFVNDDEKDKHRMQKEFDDLVKFVAHGYQQTNILGYLKS
jgi:hypothetical protein